MGEREPLRMQRLARHAERRGTAVQGIADQRVAALRQVSKSFIAMLPC